MTHASESGWFRLVCFALAASLAACGGGDPPSLRAVRDTAGDTITIRTIAGSRWGTERSMEPEVRVGTLEGEDVYMLGDVHGLGVGADGSMYVYDRQVPALRQYDGDGRYLSTFGREGGGPGEYRQSDGGLAVLPDGRVLLRDPANGRINVYSAVGEPLDHWPLRGGHFTSRPLYVDTAGNIYTQIWGTNADGERYGGLQRISPDGEPGDSLLAPDWDYEPALLTAAGESFRMSSAVPFTPREVWAFSPDGSFVGGVADAYEFDVFRPDGTVLRIGREYDPVPVHPDEAENARARTAANFKGMAPDWRWNGPGIPD
ncbi:MAG: hypothetical protein ACLFRX_06695, partial [Gemmatimonadota bacterium]